MLKLRARSAALFGFIVAAAICGFAPQSAQAGNIYTLQCSWCTTVNDFKGQAGFAAAQRGHGGTFQVVGGDNALSAYIRVSGQHATTCDSNGECRSYFRVLSMTSVTSGGSPAGTAADLSRNDAEIFGTSRPQRIPPIALPTAYQSSIINSLDEEIGPGINAALVAKGINPGSIPVGTVVKVMFADGTSATFIKISGSSSLQWEWTGDAWDANGNPINRNGTPKTNPNVGGFFGGSAEGSFVDREGANVVYSMTTSSKCIKIVTISVNGIRWGSWLGWTSCP